MSASSDPVGAGLADSRGTDTGLRGSMGILELIFTVVAYNGPVVVFLGFIPAMVLLGNGAGTPVIILACGAIIALVAVGLLAMTKRVDKPGGFYALITAGLGRHVGLAAGFAALICYFLALVSVYAYGGIALDGVVAGLFGGPSVSWIAYGFIILLMAGALGYFNINFSAKVLTVFLAAELLLIMAYVVSVFFQGGADGITFDSFTPDQITSGSLAIGLLFGIGLFGGFEATVIFRDEVKDPQRTIRRATFGVVALLAGMYALTSWAFVNSYGADVIVDIVTNDLAGSSTNSIKEYTGTLAYDLATIMLFTSAFALVLAAHNITSRYLFNLGGDGVLPKALAKAHPRHVSPYRASMVVSAASAVVLVVFIILDVAPGDLYARLAGLYSYAFVVLLVMVSLAIGVFLLRRRGSGQDATGPAIASLVGFAVVTYVLVLATREFTLLTGATGTPKAVLLAIIWGVTIGGLIYAEVLRRTKPTVYASIGRQ